MKDITAPERANAKIRHRNARGSRWSLTDVRLTCRIAPPSTGSNGVSGTVTETGKARRTQACTGRQGASERSFGSAS
jgi:hypothetical protein